MKRIVLLSALTLIFAGISGCNGDTKTSISSSTNMPLSTTTSVTTITPVNTPEVAESIIYENTKYNFTLKFPKSWDGKYDVIEAESSIKSVGFFNKANKPSSGGQLFSIGIWPKEKWSTDGEELTKIIHISKIGETGDQIFTLSTPTDVQYSLDDEKKKKEYLTMFNDIESIKATFEFIK